MTNDSLQNKVFFGMAWRLFERGSIQFINFILQIVLARLLSPDDYGVLAIITVFVSLSTTIVNNGLANAIIQKQDSDELDINTVFWVQLFLAGTLVLILYILAPYIASYYDNLNITSYLRVISFLLLIEALVSIQLTVLRKQLDFKKSFFANLFGTITYGAVGVSMAIMGCGCWSLIISQIAMKTVVFIVLMVQVKWIPLFQFSLRRLKSMFNYSWKLTVGWLLGTLHQNVFSLVIGKYYPTSTLGYYNRAQNLPNTMTVTLNETISNVMFPTLSIIQNDRDRIKQATRRMMNLASFIVCPIMAGIAGVSRAFVYVCLTEKWAPSIVLMQLFCISYGINIINTTNMQSFNAVGRSDVFMKAEVIKRTLSLLLLLITAKINVYAVVIGLGVMGVFSLWYNSIQNIKILNYSFKEQLQDIMPSFVCSILMFLTVSIINRLEVSCVVVLVVQVLIGMCSYLFYSYIFNKQVLFNTFIQVKNILRKKG